jgi:putative restriction endonuclease
MTISFELLQIGQEYDRPFLAKLWGYETYNAISRGVINPAHTNIIILFVTKEKQDSLTQYNDYIDGNLLYWEGEEKHGSDYRIVSAQKNGDQIHLFFRNIHHIPFTYFGKISLLSFVKKQNKASEFIFDISSLTVEPDVFQDITSHETEFKSLKVTEKESIIRSRIGQGDFRENLIKLWGGCSITSLKNLSIINASHIKPWRDSNNDERLNPYNGLLLIPNFDCLFDKGFISFNDSGKVIVSDHLSKDEIGIFNINPELKLKKVFQDNRKFLEYHREMILKR